MKSPLSILSVARAAALWFFHRNYGRRAILVGALGLAGGLHAADLQLVGNFGYTPQNNNASVVMTADRVENRTSGGNSGTIRLELWAFASRYGGGAISGYRLATHSLGQLAGGRVFTGISSGTVAMTLPPSGTWYVSMLVTEFTSASSNNGYTTRDYGNFTNTLTIGGGGGGGGGGAGGGGSGGGGASSLEFTGAYSYEPQNGNTGVVMRVDRVRNNSTGGRSGSLRLELWASTTAYSGGSLSGFKLAQHRLDPLDGGASWVNISSGTVAFTPPPTGTWQITMVLSEFSSSVSTNDGYSVRDYGGFTTPMVIGGGSTGGGGTGGGGTGGGGTPTTDDHGNARTTATALALNTTLGGRINTAGDVDYFRLTVTAAGALTVFTTGGTDTVGELQDANGTVLASNDDDTDVNFRIARTVATGTYYVAVRHYSATSTGDYSVRANFTATPGSTPDPGTTTPTIPGPTTPASGGRLTNLSVRSVAGSGSQALILGCVVGGTGGKSLLVRGVGPTLSSFAVPGVLADPQLQIYSGSTLRLSNDNWGSAPNLSAVSAAFTRLGAFALPTGSRDAVVLDSFVAGGWTMQVTGPATGVALVEVYDADPTPTTAAARLINLSARTEVGTGDRVLVAGFVVAGGPRKVLIRGSGGSLRAFGVGGVLEDPVLKLFNNGTVIGESDDWEGVPEKAQIEATARAVSAFALSSGLDSALLVTLQPGNYTAQISGYGNASGVALVEVYEVP